MEIKRSDRIAFAFTVKLNTTGATDADYAPFFTKLSKFNIEVEYKIPEFDSKSRLHYHGIIYLKKGFFRKRIMVPGMHIKLEEIYNKSGWEKYIHKDCEFINMPKSPVDLLRKKLF